MEVGSNAAGSALVLPSGKGLPLTNDYALYGSAQVAAALFEEPMWAEVYAAGCSDTGDPISLEQARLFHDAVLAQNPNRRTDRLSLR
eukprot:2298478-Amphidinium_carterae.1